VECARAKTLLLEHQRGRLNAAAASELEAHLAGCELCRRTEAEERVLGELLERRLPRHAAPEALKAKLHALSTPAPPTRTAGRRTAVIAALAMAAGILVMLVPYGRQAALLSEARAKVLLDESVNEHLRVLDTPLSVASSDPHTVKPWFQGRLDFAPAVAFEGDGDFTLEGGVVSHFLDRKAATFVFKHKLHVISVFVFRADGLALEPQSARTRGFSVCLLRSGELGYALVSDVNPPELERLATKLLPP
jgi:anti-sigma factor RsiW